MKKDIEKLEKDKAKKSERYTNLYNEFIKSIDNLETEVERFKEIKEKLKA